MCGLAIYENAEFRQMLKFLQQFVRTVSLKAEHF